MDNRPAWLIERQAQQVQAQQVQAQQDQGQAQQAQAQEQVIPELPSPAIASLEEGEIVDSSEKMVGGTVNKVTRLTNKIVLR